MIHCNEHLQVKVCAQKVYCGTHCDTLQLSQDHCFFIFRKRTQECIVGMKGQGDGEIVVHDVKFTMNQYILK